MSRSRPKKMKELTTGVHLVTVSDASPLFDGVVVRFTDGFNKSFDQNYSLEPDKIFALKKLCAVTGTDIRSKDFKGAIADKRLWIAIKEVHETGKDVNHFVFDTIMMDSPEHRPIISGDPLQHPKGIPLGVFIEHKSTIPGDDVPVALAVAVDAIEHPKAKVIADAKEMIKKVENKEMTSLNQPNNKPVQKTNWEDF